MQGFGVLIAVVALGGLAVVQADNKEKIMPRYIKYTLDCVKEGGVDIATCKEMMKEGNDNSPEKYNQCKCVIACVAKKAKIMKESGDPDIPAFTAAVDEFEIKEWTDEWKRVQPMCEPVIKGKKECVLGYDFFMCGYEKSEIFRDVIKKFMGSMEKQGT